MDILYVAKWSAPNTANANSASSGVHLEISKRNLEIGVLSSLEGHTLEKNNFNSIEIGGFQLVELIANDIKYLMPNLPKGWSSRHIHNEDWNDAVRWGVELLKKYKPKKVHIQQWQDFWWMAQAAIQCSIPYNFTPYDFGLICARTVLIKSDGSKCNGNVDDATCQKCIYQGRGLVGKINENIVNLSLFSRGLKLLLKFFPGLNLHERGIVVDPIQVRLQNDRQRLNNLLLNLDNLVVNSDFTNELFSSKAKINNVVTIPWFHNLNVSNPEMKKVSDTLTVGFISRISPEKGLDVLLESVSFLKKERNIYIKLVVAGDASTEYASNLKEKYNYLDIEWMGWVDSRNLIDVYNQIDLLVVPSISYDNGPITIMEAIATKTPVIVSNNKTLLTYLKNVKTEHTFESSSSDSLARLIEKYVEHPNMRSNYVLEMPQPVTVDVYVDQLMKTY